MRRAWSLLLLLVGLALLAFLVWVLQDPSAFRRSWLLETRLEAWAPDVYGREDLPDEARAELLDALAQARERADAACGGLRATPIVVFADTAGLKEAMAVGNPFAKSVFHRDRVMAIVGPRGGQVDVLAHLLLHAEIKARLGRDRFEALPNWFDEALACQVDERPFLSAAALAELPPPVERFAAADMPPAETFQGSSGERQLAFAKRQLAAWQRKGAPGAAWRLLDAFAAGASFAGLYGAAEALPASSG